MFHVSCSLSSHKSLCAKLPEHWRTSLLQWAVEMSLISCWRLETQQILFTAQLTESYSACRDTVALYVWSHVGLMLFQFNPCVDLEDVALATKFNFKKGFTQFRFAFVLVWSLNQLIELSFSVWRCMLCSCWLLSGSYFVLSFPTGRTDWTHWAR